MSVDLFCYVSEPVEKARGIVDALVSEHAALFRHGFSATRPHAAGENDRDIVLEHRFPAQSVFLVHLDDKGFAGLVLEVSGKIKAAFGEDSVLVLHNNGRKI